MVKASFKHKTLHFKRRATTSRGSYTTRDVWYITITSSKKDEFGIGECAPLPDLSCDDMSNYEEVLKKTCQDIEEKGNIDKEVLTFYPSILFGVETALFQFFGKNSCLFESNFTKGISGIPINGLVWMGSYEDMLSQMKEKLEKGFRCIKIKIGAIDFDEELKLLSFLRNNYSPKIELRLDANGAFSYNEAIEKLKILSQFNPHSIEQPIKQGQWEEMAELCAKSPIPIALDEELIGINKEEDKIKLLKTIRPKYVVLKPTLHGAISGAVQWASLAFDYGAGFWITSALESSVGLNAIAQWCGSLELKTFQGLSTGELFLDKIESPLYLKGDSLWYDAQKKAKQTIL